MVLNTEYPFWLGWNGTHRADADALQGLNEEF